MSSAKWRPFCLGLNVLTYWGQNKMANTLQIAFIDIFSWIKIMILIQISPEYVLEGPIDKK